MAALGKLAIYGLAALIAIIMAAKAHDQLFAFQMVICRHRGADRAGGDCQAYRFRCAATRNRRLFRQRHPLWRHRHAVLGRRRLHGRRGHRPATGLAGVRRRAMVELRPFAAAAHLGGDLRFRRQRAHRHLVLRGAAHLSGAPGVRQAGLVRVLGLSALHRAGGHRLSHGHHPVARICRAGMVCGPVDHRGVGGLPAGVPRHPLQAQGTPHLRRQLVLPLLHRDHRHAACGQQPGGAGVVPRLQELFAVLRRAGRAHPVVVRP